MLYNQARIPGPDFFVQLHCLKNKLKLNKKPKCLNQTHITRNDEVGKVGEISFASLFVPQIIDLKKCNLKTSESDACYKYCPLYMSRSIAITTDVYWREETIHLVAGVARVELGQNGGWDPLQHLLGEDSGKKSSHEVDKHILILMTWEAAIRCQETQRQCGSHSCPAKSRVIEDENEPSSSGRYGFSASRGESTYLGNEVLLKLAKELKIEQVVRCQGFLTNNCLHRLHNTCQQKST